MEGRGKRQQNDSNSNSQLLSKEKLKPLPLAGFLSAASPSFIDLMGSALVSKMPSRFHQGPWKHTAQSSEFVCALHAQCYLKDTAARIEADMGRAATEGWAFGAKTVRGAYMVVERARAQALGYDSPIQDTLQATHDNYDRCLLPAPFKHFCVSFSKSTPPLMLALLMWFWSATRTC